MKRLLPILLVLFLIYPVLAVDNSTAHTPDEATLRGIVREFPADPPIPIETPEPLLDVYYDAYSPDLIQAATKIIKDILEPLFPTQDTTALPALVNATPESVMAQPQNIVSINGNAIALISQSSELNGRPVHAFCDRLGYGTSEWIECERSIT
jgi:hypothetical protein